MARPSGIDQLSLADLKRLITLRKSQAGELRRERAKLLKRIAQIDAQLGSSANSGGRRSRPRNEVTLPDAIEGVLKSGKPMGVGDIAAAVQAAGYRSNAAKFNAVVNLTLIKDKKRFAKVERGVYALKKS